jgi:hypothetical protein
VEVVKACKQGEGQDRHLQGLYWRSLQLQDALEDFKMPEFFDATYFEYMSNRLSTSNVGGGFAGACSLCSPPFSPFIALFVCVII